MSDSGVSLSGEQSPAYGALVRRAAVIPGWVGPGRKGWINEVRHPCCDPFCTIPVQPAPESKVALLNRTTVGWLAGFQRFRLAYISIDQMLTYSFCIDMIIVCLRYLRFSKQGLRSLPNFKL